MLSPIEGNLRNKMLIQTSFTNDNLNHENLTKEQNMQKIGQIGHSLYYAGSKTSTSPIANH